MIPLHLPSHWSPGRGAASPAELVERASLWGLPALALTDVENLSGAVEFHHRCRVAGIHAILGVELRPGIANGSDTVSSRRGRLVLLARNTAGYRSLCRIVSRRRTGHPAAEGADPVADVLEDREGLFALSDDPAPIERLLEAGFARRFARLLWVRPRRSAREEEGVFEAARRQGIRIVADLDPAGLDPDDGRLLRLRKAIRDGNSVRGVESPACRTLLPPWIAARLFADRPDAIAEAARVADACEGDVLPRAPGFPVAALVPGETPTSRLGGLARAALETCRAEGRLRGEAYDTRLASELTVLDETGLAPWLLGIAEIVAFARSRGIPVVARGSAVGSLLVHLVAAGPVDPLAAGLFFERFVSRHRSSPPDVDLDLPARRREEVIAWVLGRWTGHAAAVGAHVRFGPRSARADAARALSPGTEGTVSVLPPEVDRLIGAPRHLSVHPAGIVLCRPPVRDVAPLETSPKGVDVTQLDGAALDALGIVKLDLLGNTSLDALDRSIRRAGVLAERGIEGIPADDPGTLDRLSAGDTVGCSQIETPAVRAALRRRAIRSLEDLAATLAAVRPAASDEGRREAPLYEEDIMRRLAEAGGLTLSEADDWRSKIVAVDDTQALSELGRCFVRIAVERGRNRGEAQRAWSEAAPFANYAFSKAHASSCALVAYRAAFMRTHFPAEYGCAVVDDHGGAYPRRTIIGEVARWGLDILPPSINSSELRSVLIGRAEIRLGLDHVKRLTSASRLAILTSREEDGRFHDLVDLLRRVRLSIGEIESLVLSGSCDDLDPTKPDGFPFVHEAIVGALRSGARPEILSAASWRVDEGRESQSPFALERYRRLVRARNELRYLGSTPTAHPLEVLREDADRIGCRTIADVRAGRQAAVRIAAVPALTRGCSTSRGPMRFITWEDETGLLESSLSPGVHRSLAPIFDAAGAYLIEGHLRGAGPDAHLDIRALVPFERRQGGTRRVRGHTEG